MPNRGGGSQFEFLLGQVASAQSSFSWSGMGCLQGCSGLEESPAPLSSGNSSARAEGVHGPVKTGWLPGHVPQSTPRYRLISLIL